MANRTDPLAKSIRGTNPQNLVEKIVRTKIYQNTYWKEQCFGLTAETLVDKAMELDHIGGTYGGNRKPTPFMCLVMKMLQIQPEKDIVVEFIKNEDYKYVRILGAFYLRLAGTDSDIYLYLEPLYNDYRKLRMKKPDGQFLLTHVDEFIDELLTKDYSCDIAMPRIKKSPEVLNSKEILCVLLWFLMDYRGRSPVRDRDRRRDSHRYRDRRDRDRGRRRSRSRSRSRSKDRKDREGDRKRHGRSPSPRRHGDEDNDHPDPEIAEANKLRAKLGMKPLKL
uniref:Pre-mRNA-splicing factor 38 n=1 Tax=Chenopodium quinoa TaxID=63459 RepID=A0A803KNW5_CHEQI